MKNNRSLRDIPLWKIDGDKNRTRIRPLPKFQGKTIFQLQKLSARARKDLDFELAEKIDSELKDRIKKIPENDLTNQDSKSSIEEDKNI